MTSIGGRVYGLGAITLGIPGLIAGNFAVMGLAVPPHTPGYHLFAYVSAALLVLGGIAINLPRIAWMASLVLAAFFALIVLAVDVPAAAAAPTVWVSWEGLAEGIVMALGGVLAFALMPAAQSRAALVTRYAIPLFGLCLVIFGTSEFVYSKFTAALVPIWLPPSPLFWTYATGAAHITAGLAILSRVQARRAATLLTAMYIGFSLLVHFPRVIADPATAMAWGENGVNLVLTGAAWVLAETLGGRFRRRTGFDTAAA